MTSVRTDFMTSIQTATVTDHKTDFVTLTSISTKIQPTTYTSVYVSTVVNDKVCNQPVYLCYAGIDMRSPD